MSSPWLVWVGRTVHPLDRLDHSRKWLVIMVSSGELLPEIPGATILMAAPFRTLLQLSGDLSPTHKKWSCNPHGY